MLNQRPVEGRLPNRLFPYIEVPILNLINRSIIEMSFPDSLKTSKIIPILKQGKIEGDPSSYRSINLLPGISKILQKVVFQQVVNHLDTRNILPHNLHGS